MMSRVLLPFLLLSASALSAQMPGTAAKRAAANAANAANAQLAKQTGQAVPQKAGPTPAAPTTAAPAKTAPATAAPPAATVRQSGAPVADSAKSNAAQPPIAATPAAPAAKDSTLILREAYGYERDGRRDPFVSLMTTNDLRPTLSDLRLTSVLFDHSGRRPVAVLRDSIAGVQWRVTTGMSLGRMRVNDIRPKVVVFTIEEFGFSRQDSLVLGDTTRARARSR
jgi:hypothetical protein